MLLLKNCGSLSSGIKVVSRNLATRLVGLVLSLLSQYVCTPSFLVLLEIARLLSFESALGVCWDRELSKL